MCPIQETQGRDAEDSIGVMLNSRDYSAYSQHTTESEKLLWEPQRGVGVVARGGGWPH